MVRQSIALLLRDSQEITVVAAAGNGKEAVTLAGNQPIDVILMDVRMPGVSGLEATHRILADYPHIKVIGLSGYNDSCYPGLFLRAGAHGYISKESGLQEMVSAIKAVNRGEGFLSPDVARRVAEQRENETENPFSNLSERELQIALLLLESYQLEDIADQLALTLRSVRNYRKKVFTKLDIKTEVELTLQGLRFGMIEADRTLRR
jgi:two-component system invasion response regulator UvrY